MSTQKKTNLTFAELVLSIRQAYDLFSAQASKAVNISLTLRNWSIGYYIERYERLGVDRAKYGERLMDDLSETLRELGLSRCDRRELYRYRQFYLTYPQIVEAAAPQLTAVLQNKQQWQLLTVKSKQRIAGSAFVIFEIPRWIDPFNYVITHFMLWWDTLPNSFQKLSFPMNLLSGMNFLETL